MKAPSPHDEVTCPWSTTDLVTRARAGDADAWTAIVRQFDGLLHSVAVGFRLNADDAADAIQLTWLRLFENMHKIRQSERLVGWLSSTMRRECIRTYHRRSREWFTGEHTELTFADVDGADVEVLRTERDRILWAGIERLPARQRDLLRLFFSAPTLPSYDEVGAALDLATGSVGPIRMRALLRLREIIGESGVLEDDLV